MKLKITQAEIKKLLNYDPETGVFTWRVRRPSINVGDIAGCINKETGYALICTNRKRYMAHRLAWLYVHGYLPEHELDHINRIRTDNRILNLREVSRMCNIRNTGNFCNNKSGVKGVYWNERCGKWQVQITVNLNRKHLGYYNDFDDAVCARLAGEQCLSWSGCDSCSPAFRYVQENIISQGGRHAAQIH